MIEIGRTLQRRERVLGLCLVALVVLIVASQHAIAAPAFDRLRIRVATTSDWTTLRLAGAECFRLSSATLLTGTGNFQATPSSLSVSQPPEAASAGRSVSVQFDVILESAGPPAVLFESTKGSLGQTSIDFFSYNTQTPALVAGVANDVTGGDLNSYWFSVAAIPLLDGETSWPRPAVAPRVLAFYYPWYGFESWAASRLADQLPQPYSSDNPATIARHVHLAKSAGIDGFISSWWGPASSTDRNLQRLLDLADPDFAVSIYLETLGGEPARARPEAELLAWLRYFLRTYGRHPRLLRHDGKPVVFVWAADSTPIDVWRRVFAALRAEGLDALYSANTLDPAYLDVFDGLHAYCSAFRSDLDAEYRQASGACRFYGWLGQSAPPVKFWAAAAAPGHDERLLPGSAGRFVDRLAGATYTRALDSALCQTAPSGRRTAVSTPWLIVSIPIVRPTSRGRGQPDAPRTALFRCP